MGTTPLLSPSMRGVLFLLVCLVTITPSLLQAKQRDEASILKPEQEELMRQSLYALRDGKTNDAFALALRAIRSDPTNYLGFRFRGQLREAAQQFELSVADYTLAIQQAPQKSSLYLMRARVLFKAGRVNEGIVDWAHFIETEKDALKAPELFDYGIANVIADKMDVGRKQFEWYATLYPDDVENAAWHFLCVAKKDGVDAARAQLMKVGKDERPPMMALYGLFKGTNDVAAVWSAVAAGNPTVAERDQREFWARLYIGIYYEASGRGNLATRYLGTAAAMARTASFTNQTVSYMIDVGRVYRDKLRQRELSELNAAIEADPENQKARNTARWIAISILLAIGWLLFRVSKTVQRPKMLSVAEPVVAAQGSPGKSEEKTESVKV